MKKRILLSLVSFFMMTAMWASLIEAYMIEAAGANGKTNSTATLTLNMTNRTAVAAWTCTLVLPEGVTFENATVSGGRYPEGYAADLKIRVNNDNSVVLTCQGESGVNITGTAGEVATVTVSIANTVTPGEVKVYVNNIVLLEGDGTRHERETTEFTWIIEQGEEPGIEGDLNGDDSVDISDGVVVLDAIANGDTDSKYDLNKDGFVDISDFVFVLDLMAS